MVNCLKHKLDVNQTTSAREIVLSGQVQGVGFRPFIYRLAQQHGLVGWVKNCVGTVEILVQGRPHNLNSFFIDIFEKKPALAKPKLESDQQTNVTSLELFSILQSEYQAEANISVPSDLFLCDECLAELNDPSNRRYRYPFINCTQCGPRYTLIKSLPYDRANTTMAAFELCPACLTEYEDPLNRRFHAEPMACPDCGPSLTFVQRNVIEGEETHNYATASENDVAIQKTIAILRQGGVVAVKGIGGYHLMCDATNDVAVSKLRDRKHRPHKPFAVMFPVDVDNPFKIAESSVLLNPQEKEFLLQPARPILLVKKNNVSILSKQVAPGLNEVGIMLPYSPLHHLLLNAFSAPLVATSANISGEPVLIENEEVEKRLVHIADAFLHHNRPIERPADDPVYRIIAGKPRPIRIGRGSAPLELKLPFELEQPLLAVGAHMKNTITLAWKNRAVISPHIGGMGTARSLAVFESIISDLQKLYGIKAEAVICDAHPGYVTTRWANKQALPVHSVFHHHAHASAAYYDCLPNIKADEAVLMFSWDGVGYGEDGTLWGGETFLGRPGEWQRVASIEPFRPPGGDKAGKEPWRSAAAVSWQIGQSYNAGIENWLEKETLLKQAWQQEINAPKTSSMGRLFDAAAALTDTCIEASFEGQGPMLLEVLAESELNTVGNNVEFDLSIANNILIYRWNKLISSMSDFTLTGSQRASLFHRSLAHLILIQAKVFREKHAVNTISFSGGVFQNRVLTEQAIALLKADGFEICLSELIPVNDAGISFGQIMEYGYTR